LDSLHGGLGNFLAYSHEVYCKGEESQVDPIDVMDCIHRDMYECILYKKGPVLRSLCDEVHQEEDANLLYLH
jgi:hypothetical protein